MKVGEKLGGFQSNGELPHFKVTSTVTEGGKGKRSEKGANSAKKKSFFYRCEGEVG